MHTRVDFWSPENRESCERRWLIAQESREIGRAFKRARLRGLQRRLLSFAGLIRPVRDPIADGGAAAIGPRLERVLADCRCLIDGDRIAS